MVAPLPPKLTPELVFREYAPRIYNLARRMLGNDADAEDVTQDVLLQVVRKLDTFRGDSQIATWLHRVTVNAALAHRAEAGQPSEARDQRRDGRPRRDRWPRRRGEALERPAGRAGPRGRASRLIEEAINKLPEPFRDVYVLADVEGLPNPEIAEMLKLSVPAVKSRLHRARLRMRDALAPHFEEATP